MAIEDPSTLQNERTVLLLYAGGERFSLPADSVREIVPMATLTRLSPMPAILEGILNVSGTAIPVIRLDALFGLPCRQPQAYTPIILLRNPEMPAGLLAERIISIVTVPASSFLPLDDAGSFNGCVEGTIRVEDETYPLISIDRILLEKERQAIESFRNLETARLRDLERVKS